MALDVAKGTKKSNRHRIMITSDHDQMHSRLPNGAKKTISFHIYSNMKDLEDFTVGATVLHVVSSH